MDQALTAPDPSDPFAAFESAGYVGGFVAVFLVAAAVQVLMQAVVLGYVERYRRGEAGKITPAWLWEATKAALGPVVGTTLLVLGLAVLALFGIGMVAAVVPALGGLLGLAALPTAVYLFPLLTLLYVARVADGGGLGEAFARTRDYVKGRWWQTFGLIVVVLLILVGVSIVVSIPGGVLRAALSFNTLDGAGSLRVVVLAVEALLGTVSYAAYVIPLVATAFQYFSLAERQEGTGLLAEVDALGQLPERPPAKPAPLPAPTTEPAPEVPTEVRGFRGGGFEDAERSSGRTGPAR